MHFLPIDCRTSRLFQVALVVRLSVLAVGDLLDHSSNQDASLMQKGEQTSFAPHEIGKGSEQRSCLIQKQSKRGKLSNWIGDTFNSWFSTDSKRQDWRALKKNVIDRCKEKSNVTKEDVEQAVRELEQIGKSSEDELLQAAHPSSRKALRQEVFTALQQQVENQSDREARSEQSIQKALGSVLPRSESLLQPSKTVTFDGEWVVGSDCTSCDDVCSNRSNSQNLFCHEQATDALNDNNSIAHAVETVGLTCAVTVEVPGVSGKWDGPWFTGDGKSGTCGFNNGEFGESSCSLKPACGYRRICACSSTNSTSPVAPKPGPFADIELSVDLGPDLLHPASGAGNEMRAIVGHKQLQALGASCLIYSFGAGYETGYEKLMSDFGCRVHVFDCTMVDSPERLLTYLDNVTDIDNVVFHPWCLGEHGSEYHGSWGKAPSDFFTLDEIFSKLGHDSVDIVKFDIEGFEWKVFQSLLSGKNLPDQIAFELHTYGAKPQSVPPELVKYKGRREVAELFDQLYSKNYRVASKDVNIFDGACCEFVVVQI